jgi:hypothetical protein
MADPNTQIDWWIAQAWQEAQGGADNDALVTWLHENGLTAISSYTILQAALSCPPEEAKEIVFGHPAWAGEEPDADVDNLDYTSDTLEPEPEPDAAFELDDWAENIEEDEPVYGEEGYQPDPGAGAAPPEYDTESSGRTDTGGAISLEPALSGTAVPAQAFEEAGRFDDAAGFEEDAIGLDPTPASEPVPHSAPMQDDPMAPKDAMPVAANTTPPESAPAPTVRKPPATPSERAAVFAAAFGKKPAAAPLASPDPEPAPKRASDVSVGPSSK